MKDFFRKHGDKVLFVLALAFLAAALFRREGSWRPVETRGVTPRIVFTQWWEGNLDKDTLRELAKEFEELHNGIKVTIEYRSYEDLRRDLFASAEASSPDNASFVGDGSFVADVVALDPLWIPELLEMGSIEDTAITLFSFIDVLYYNVDILKNAGFSRPPKDRSEFIEYARTLAGSKELLPGYVLAFALSENSSRGVYDDVFPWIWAAGVRLINDGNPVVNSRQVVESLAFLSALNNEGLIAPDTFRADAARKLEHFISGEVAFMVAPTVYVKQVRERMGDEAFGITSVPAPDNYFGRPLLATAGWALGVHSGSQLKEEARLFAEFLAGKDSAFSEQTGAVPGNGAPPARDAFYSKVWDIAISGESARDFAGLPWTEMEAAFRDGIVSLFAGRMTPTEAATAIQERLREKREE
jgi:ABC-type glycerol-3-phosphate transport system substrate-binding protein